MRCLLHIAVWQSKADWIFGEALVNLEASDLHVIPLKQLRRVEALSVGGFRDFRSLSFGL